MIGSGGADGYVTRGIPHAWLVSPKGKVVWEGYPTDLKVEQIQEHLKDVRLAPRFELPEKMKETENALNEGRFGHGLRLLKEHAEGADGKLTKTARETADKVMAYGKERLQEAEDLIGQDGYGNAVEILTDLMTSFQGTEIADRARARQTALREDPRIRVELEGRNCWPERTNSSPKAPAPGRRVHRADHEIQEVREQQRTQEGPAISGVDRPDRRVMMSVPLRLCALLVGWSASMFAGASALASGELASSSQNDGQFAQSTQGGSSRNRGWIRPATTTSPEMSILAWIDPTGRTSSPRTGSTHLRLPPTAGRR